MKENITISSMNSTEIEFIVEKHEQIMSKSDLTDKSIWHSLAIETYSRSNTEMIASLKFNTISASDLEVIANCLSRLAARMRTEQPIK